MDDPDDPFASYEPVRYARTADRPGRFEMPCTDPVLRRIAAIGKDAAQVKRFERLLARGFVPSACIREGLGTGSSQILVDGFPQPIGDSLTETDHHGEISITQALAQTAEILRHGASVGIDFSPLRPSGSKAGTAGCRAAGPTPYLRLFEQLHATVRGGHAARGRFTAALRIDHPDIEAFMADPVPSGSSRCVLMTSAFVEALSHDAAFELRYTYRDAPAGDSSGSPDGGQATHPTKTVRARDLWHRILTQTCDQDVGIAFVDVAQARTGLFYCEWLEMVSHPGGPLLPAYGAMPQGKLVLPAFLVPFGPTAADFDWEAFDAAVAVAVEFLDRVVDVTECPLPEQQVELRSKRRIGLSCSGLADILAEMHTGPSTIEGMCICDALWCHLREQAVKASVELARANGSFPLFDADHFPCPGGFASTPTDKALLETIRRDGIRNSHLLSGSFTENERRHALRPQDRLQLSRMAVAQFDGDLMMPLRIARRPTIDQATGVVLRAWFGGATSVLLRRKRLPLKPPAYCFEEAAPEVIH